MEGDWRRRYHGGSSNIHGFVAGGRICFAKLNDERTRGLPAPFRQVSKNACDYLGGCSADHAGCCAGRVCLHDCVWRMPLERGNVDRMTKVKVTVFPMACLIYHADGSCCVRFQSGQFLLLSERLLSSIMQYTFCFGRRTRRAIVQKLSLVVRSHARCRQVSLLIMWPPCACMFRASEHEKLVEGAINIATCARRHQQNNDSCTWSE